jgi:hypothetical protein
MKKLILISCLLVAGISYAQDQKSGAWRDDLDYLVQNDRDHASESLCFFPQGGVLQIERTALLKDYKNTQITVMTAQDFIGL